MKGRHHSWITMENEAQYHRSILPLELCGGHMFFEGCSLYIGRVHPTTNFLQFRNWALSFVFRDRDCQQDFEACVERAASFMSGSNVESWKQDIAGRPSLLTLSVLERFL